MKKLFWIAPFFLIITGCAHNIAVATLESTIQQAAIAAKKAAGNTSDKLTIEVSVVNGYTASATIPIPLVPIGAGTELKQSTKLTMDIDLSKIVIPKVDRDITTAPPTLYYLDIRTGMLTKQQ